MSPPSATMHSQLKRDYGFPGTFESRNSPEAPLKAGARVQARERRSGVTTDSGPATIGSPRRCAN